MPDTPRRIPVKTSAREQLVDISGEVRAAIRAEGLTNGLIYLWSLHTTCGLTVNEGADPDVARDVVNAMRQVVPHDGNYKHAEGNSDSHIKTSLFGPGLMLIVENGEPVLGTWQHVFLAEWDGPRKRSIAYSIVAAP